MMSRIVRIDFSKARRRGRGRPFSFNLARKEFEERAIALYFYAERILKERGVYRYRKEAERLVVEQLQREGWGVKVSYVTNLITREKFKRSKSSN